MRARAVIFPDKLQVAFQDVTVPDPGRNDVVVETRYSWISNGTEGSFLRGERINGETPYRPGDPWPFPIAAGYQSTGIVESVGAGVADIAPGQWVFGAIGGIDGMYERGGGHISPKVMDRAQVWPLPDGVSPVAASGLVLTQVGYNCGMRAPVAVGDTALVIGDGMVGHWAAQTLHWRGATTILAGKHDDRLNLFAGAGRRHQVNTTRENLVESVRTLAPEGVNVLVDTVGSVPAILECHPLMRHNGHVVSAGFNGTESMLDIQKLRFGELSFHSPSGWQKRRMDETLALIASGHLDTEGLITHRFPVEQAADAWKLILERAEPVLGVVLTWT
jgi:bacteriochlorophyllide a dehydrogenase